MRSALFIGLALALVGPAAAADGLRGVINDPDGYVNVRRDKGVDAPVVARVKPGQVFSFAYEPGDEWCRVSLSSGKKGWMHHSRVRLHFTGKDLRGKTDPTYELHYIRKKLGVDYYELARRAAAGEPKELKMYFGINDTDGAGAESHFTALPEVFHLVGDDKFADFLGRQPLAYQLDVRASIASDRPVAVPFETVPYLRRHFPRTAKLFFRGEIVDWPSPDGRYAIRKVFSDAEDLANSKVARAELIEKGTFNVVCDLTRDDIGTAHEREGGVLWSSDSRRFAYLSMNLRGYGDGPLNPSSPPPERKQTTVYQASGETFVKVELPLSELPGRENDVEVKGAVVGHEFVEPVRWDKPDVLVLERHEYFQKLRPKEIEGLKFDEIYGFDRLYEITATIHPDNTATATVKLREDR